jgi:hypothetical protein
MVEVFLVVTSLINIVASIVMYRRWLNTSTPQSQKSHVARAHYLCVQALQIEQMPNSYAKMVAYDEWRKQLHEYDAACQQQQQAVPEGKRGFRVV